MMALKMNFKINQMKNLLQCFVRAFFLILIVEALSLNPQTVWGNNLTMTNLEVVNADTAANTITFSCNFAWDNSWRNTTNFDAVWVILKFSTDAGITWSHASMSSSGTNPLGFSVSPNFEIIVPSDEKGFFLQRVDFGTGSVSASNVKFVWDYAQDGLSDAAAMAANTINKIFGVEMVYIPQGAYYLGDGTSSSEYSFKQGSSDTEPWYIQGESAITTTNTATDGYYYQGSGASGENNSGDAFLISSSFPKGHHAFYLMKYELTEGQWVSFFNALSSTARVNRDITSSTQGGKNSDGVVNRNTVSWDPANSNGFASTSRPDRPVTYVSWPDIMAYADWAALRPVTEMEFDKAARGKDVVPLADEFAWGRNAYVSADAAEIYPNTDENGSEQIFNGNVNINRNSLSWTSGDGRTGGLAEGQKGPLRVGIFAENSTSRATSGAGFYGNMELSGNLYEMVVTVGRPQGRQFLGSHGDGQLSAVSGYEGNATNIDWPGINQTDDTRGVTGTTGMGYRGGDFQISNIREFQTSSRTRISKDADSSGYAQRYDASFGVFQGGRLGRTAP